VGVHAVRRGVYEFTQLRVYAVGTLRSWDFMQLGVHGWEVTSKERSWIFVFEVVVININRIRVHLCALEN
jgi:hypothetical protein